MTAITLGRKAFRHVAAITAVAGGAALVAGCALIIPSLTDPGARSSPSVVPLSDEQARAQVVDAAREIVHAANIQITYATFEWESCNDQGDPPYHGLVNVAYVVPPGVDGATSSRRVAAAAAAMPGWSPGPPPGLRPFGEIAHRGGIMAIAGVGNYPDRDQLEVVGECRDTTDHHGDNAAKDITAEVG
jgi:hypothetical protein